MNDSTKRAVILDYGYVELVETWGSEERIIEAARMSTGKGFLGWGPNPCPMCEVDGRSVEQCVAKVHGDEKLLRYLHENAHATPFEMAGAIVEVKAPIFVFREWHRHRTQSYNEMSARYTSLPDENYVPTVERLMVNSKSNKQAGTVKGAAELTEKDAEGFRESLRMTYSLCEDLYQKALASGVPKELARVHLPVGRYSRMRASANLRNWLAFLTLREAPGAQWEIRQYAGALHTILKTHFPRTLALHEEGKR
jgi:thymidylate synthase (FAD)